MGLQFERAVGAGADVKELEYVVALLQTSVALRSNATVSSLDIVAQLKSRYSLTISHEQAIDVVRSLGGGDTYRGKGGPAERNGFDLVNAKEAISSAISAAYDRLKTPFLTQSSQGDDQEKRDSLDHVTSAATSKATVSKMMNRLNMLHEAHQNGGMSQHDLMALQDQIVASLRAKVAEKTLKRSQATRHLEVTLDDSDDEDSVGGSHHVLETSSEPKNLGFAKEEGEGVKSEDEKDGILPVEQALKDQNVPLSMAETAKEVSATVERPDMAEYLDLVQLLSTLLIPKCARVAYDIEMAKLLFDQVKDSTTDTAKEPRLATKLKMRFITYGRRKLDIKDDDIKAYSAQDFMKIALKALLKDFHGHDAPVLDENLVQLLLISYGEVERANDPKLVREMVDAAQTPSGLFDQAALVHAISSDLGCWDPTCEDTPTTFFYDVFGEGLPSIWTKLKADETQTTSGFSSSFNPQPKNNLKPHETHIATDFSSSTKPQLKNSQPTSGEPSGPSNEPSNMLEDAEAKKPATIERATGEELSIFTKCFKTIFPVIYESRRRNLDFSTRFLGVDMVIDASSSLVVYVLIWVTYILNTAIYGKIIAWAPDVTHCTEYGCIILEKVGAWTILAGMLICLGFYHILPLSVGNNPANQSANRQFFACAVTLVNTIIPFVIVEEIVDRENLKNPEVKAGMENVVFRPLLFLNLIVSLLLAFLFALKGFSMFFIDHGRPHLLPPLLRLIIADASWNGEVRTYQAAKFKTDRLLSNALRLHCMDDRVALTSDNDVDEELLPLSRKINLSIARDKASRNFILHGEGRENVGGMIWTYWRLFDGSLLDHEGIWIHIRLFVFQFTQIAEGVVLVFVMMYVTISLANQCDDLRASLVGLNLPAGIMEVFPTGMMIRGSWLPATCFSVFVICMYIVVYIPSTVTTILKYRGQELPSFGSPYFQKYRNNVDLAYQSTVNAIYGMLGGVLLIYFIVGIIIFLFVWPITQVYMWRAAAWGAGLAITIAFKMLVTTGCRKIQYRAFFRIKPAAARLSALALECWHIGLASSVLIARVTQFLSAALFWVGRCDVPFLSEDVVIFGYAFDYVPTNYVKDILVHEAHRHPYIERMFQMYLMKLRYGDRFVSNAGSAWRQLLVLAIFPWIAKYRVFNDERLRRANIEAKQYEEMEGKERDPYYGAKGIKNNVVAAGLDVEGEVVEVGHELYGAGEDIATEVGKIAKKGGDAVVAGGKAALRSSKFRQMITKSKGVHSVRGADEAEASDVKQEDNV